MQYEVDIALATTFSMDFDTVLTIPAMVAFRAAENRGDVLNSPLALLEGVERISKKMAIFCDAGRIHSGDSGQNRLTALIEDTVTEVVAPNGGAFHPKLWVLRFNEINGDAPPLIRLVILSRNITTDCSWDISLSLDGTLGDSEIPRNTPIADLLKSLPNMARGGHIHDRSTNIAQELAKCIMHANWDMPTGMDCVRFAVNGLSTSKEVSYIPIIGKKLCVFSPFLSSNALCELTRNVKPEDCYLVSRHVELCELPTRVLKRFGSVMVLTDEVTSDDGDVSTQSSVSSPLTSDLHAKIILTEQIDSHSNLTELTIGSGNATAAALLNNANVEVFATLSGPTNQVGGVMEQLSDTNLGPILCPWPEPHEGDEVDNEILDDTQLKKVRNDLAKAKMILCCHSGEDQYIDLTLTVCDSVRISKNITLKVWPLVPGKACSKIIELSSQRKGFNLGKFRLADVTHWIGVCLSDKDTGMELTFSRGTTLMNAPEHRIQEVFCGCFKSENDFLQYVHLLLGDQQDVNRIMTGRNEKGGHSYIHDLLTDTPIFESMVRSLSGNKQLLHDVERLMKRLTDGGNKK